MRPSHRDGDVPHRDRQSNGQTPIGNGSLEAGTAPPAPFTPEPVAEAMAIVPAYSNGQTVGSGATGIDELLERVEQVASAKAGKLRSFFDDVRNRGQTEASQAKKLPEELRVPAGSGSSPAEITVALHTADPRGPPGRVTPGAPVPGPKPAG